MRFSRTRLAPEQSTRGIPPRHRRWPRVPAAVCCGLVRCTFLKEGSTPRFDARISPYAGAKELLVSPLHVRDAEDVPLRVFDPRCHEIAKMCDVVGVRLDVPLVVRLEGHPFSFQALHRSRYV